MKIQKISKKLKLRTYIALGLILILLPIVIFSLFSASDSEAGWFDMAWGFRKRVPVTNSTGSNQTDFQVQITIDTASLITASKMQSDCDDLRITDINGKVLPQWIEPNTCNTSETMVWVKVPTVHSSGTDLYAYYGNPSASAAASGTDNVFIRDMDSAVAAWPMQETDANQSYAQAKHPSDDEGRDIVINGGFDTDTVWSKQAGWTISGGIATHTSTPSGMGQSILVKGKSYTASFDITAYTSGHCGVAGSTKLGGYYPDAIGSYSVTFTSNSDSMTFYSDGDCSIDNVSVKQIDIPGSNDFDGSELLNDGDMELADTSAWYGINGDVSKITDTPYEGDQALRLSQTGSSPRVVGSSTNLVIGKKYKVSGYVRGDGVNQFNLSVRTYSPDVSTQTLSNFNSTSWTYFEGSMVFGGTWELITNLPSGYADFDDVTVTEISPLSGSIPTAASGNRPTVNTAAGGHLSQAYSFDGSNDYVSIYSSDLNSVFNPDEGTLVAWAKVSDVANWSDGTARHIINIRSDTNNRIQIVKSTASNILQTNYLSGGTNNQVNITTSSADWLQVAISWNKASDEVKVYFNGAQSGTIQNNLGSWVGNISSTNLTIGSSDTSGSSPWKGLINDVRLYDRALSADEISSLYHVSEDREAYYTDNYEGHELIRKYHTGVGVGALAAEEVGPDPVAEWKFDEGQGQEAKDSSSNGNDGQLGSTSSADASDPTWVAEDRCISGKCLEFDGGDGIRLNSNLDVGTTHTLSGWFKQSSTQTGSQVVVGGSDTNSYGLLISEGNALFYKAQTNSVNTSQTISPNIWYHFSVVRSGTSILFYLNGNEVDSKTLGADVSNTIRAIGSTNATATFFNGFIDEVKIYPYARTAAQIKADYNQGAVKIGAPDQGALSNGLVGYWTMDETSGTTVADASGNGNTGTLTNAQETGTAEADSSSTTVIADDDNASLSTTNDAYNNMIVRITGGGGCGIATGTERLISDYAYTATPTKEITVATAFSAETDNCTFEIRHQVGGKFGNGMEFDGENDLINIPDNYDNSEVTLSAWFYTDVADITDQAIINTYANTASGWGIKLKLGDIHIYDDLAGVDGTLYSTNYETGRWNHVVATLDSNKENKLYLNGTLIGSGIYSSQDFSTITGGLYIGHRRSDLPNQWMFNGKIDETRIYNRALSPSEVKQLYQWAPGPVGYWDFEEGSGDTTVDKSGNSNNGTLTNMDELDWISGKYGGAVDLDGGNDYVTVGDPVSGILDFPLHSFTYNIWFKSSDTNTFALNKTAGLNEPGYDLIIGSGSTAGNIVARIADENNNVGTALWTGTNDSQWHYASVVVDRANNTMHLYGDGVLRSTADISTIGSLSTSAALQFGARSGGNNYAGSIDDVRIYNYARTPEQIRQDMEGAGQATAAGADPLPQPVAHWSFDEMQGQTAHDKTENTNATLGNNDNPGTDDPTWKPDNDCQINGCLSFDGNDYVHKYTSSGSPLIISNQSITLSAWVFPTEYPASRGGVFGRRYASVYSYGISLGSSGQFYTMIRNSTTAQYYNSNVSVPLNTWSHLSSVIDDNGSDTTIRYYINGQLVHTLTNAQRIGSTNDTEPIEIGTESHTYSNYFLGLIDEVKIYNTALSAEQVRQDMNQSSSLVMGNSREADDLTDGAGDPPVAEWRFDEKQGDTAHDTSGNGNDGDITGATWKSGCKYGACLDFDGNDYTDATDTSLSGAFSIEYWYKTTDNSQTGMIIGEDSGTSGGTPKIGININNFFLRIVSSSDSSVAVPSANSWHHVAITRDSSNKVDLYIDGGSPTRLFSDAAQSGTFVVDKIGVNGSDLSQGFSGLIDQVKIYDYARTPAQIAYDYNRGAPIAHWKFNECEGTTVHDSSGNENHGTLTVTTDGGNSAGVGSCNTASSAWGSGASGKYGSSINFDGNGDYVDMGTSFNLTQPYSFAAWVKTTGGGSQNIIGNFNTGVRAGPYLMVASGILTFGDSGSIDGNTSINNGNWHHVAMTGTGSTVNLYVDGKLDATGTVTLTANSTDNFLIGARYTNSLPSQLFNGQIDDVQIYNYALSPAQIKKLFNGGFATFFNE